MTGEMAHEAELPTVQHPLPRIGPRQYVIVGVFLTIVTSIELWVSYSPLGTAKIPILIVLSAVKFGVVVAFFMHLRFDNPALTRFFVFGLALAGAILIALISIFWNDQTEHRPAPKPFVKAEAGAAPAGGAAAAVSTAVGVTEHEFAITLAAAEAPAGQVKFEISNSGAVAHNIYVIKTDLAPDKLPVAGGTVDTSQVEVVAPTSADVAPGSTATVTANLAAGNYVLVCQVPGHYQLGMHAAFTVK
jgi:caa(3)-type oxidase subunit IV